MTARHEAAPLRDRGMVGRQSELAELLAAVPSDVSSAGGLRLIEGPPGIGKSRLAREVADAAEQAGTRVVWARCWDGESGPAYWLWRQVVAALVANAPTSYEAGMLDEWVATGDRSAMFGAVREILHDSVSEKPTVIVLDDLQWADPGSLLLLADLGAAVPQLPLLLLATSRGRGAVVPDAQESYERACLGATALTLAVLRPDESRALVAGLVRDRPVASRMIDRIVESGGGNPFHTREIIRLLDGRDDMVEQDLMPPVPEDLAAAVRERIGQLPEDVGEVLAWAAVVGRELDLALLAHLCAVDRVALLARLDPAFDAELLVVSGGGVVFAHDAVRDAITGGLRTSDRLRRHADVALALAEVHGDAAAPSALAYHWLQARSLGHEREAYISCCLAAEEAGRLLAHEEESVHLRRALVALGETGGDRSGEQARLLLRLGQAEARAGWTAAAIGSLQRAADAAREGGDVDLLTEVALAVPPDFEAVDNAPLTHPAQVALLEEAADLLARSAAGGGWSAGRSARAARILAKLAVARYWTGGDARDRIDESRRALDLARAANDPATLAWCLDARAYACWDQSHVAERDAATSELRTLVEKAAQEDDGTFDDDIVLDAHRWLILSLLERGQFAAAQREVTWYERRARRLKRPVHLWMVAKWRAALAFAEGRLDDAERLAFEAAEIGGRATEPQVALDSALVLIGILREQQGRTQEVAEWLASVTEDMPEVPGWRCGLAATYALAGRREAAATELDALAANDFAAIPRDFNWIPALVLLSRVVEALDDHDRARALRAELLPAAGLVAVQAFGNVVYGPIARHLGIVDTVLGDTEAAIEWYRQARDLVAGWSPNHWAISALGGGRLLLTDTDAARRAEGERLVRDAAATFHRLGMAGYAAEADAVLAARGRGRGSAPGHGPVTLIGATPPVPRSARTCCATRVTNGGCGSGADRCSGSRR